MRTRLITTIALALLMLLGFAAAGHLEGKGAAPVPMVAGALTEAQTEPVAGVSGVATSAAEFIQSDTLTGLAVCVVGVLCGLMVFMLTRMLRQRRPRSTPELQTHHRVVHLAPFIRPRMNARSLSQLGLSRT